MVWNLDRAKAMDRTVAWWVFLVTGVLFATYNIGGNLAGLSFIWGWLEQANGAMTLPWWLTHDATKLVLSTVAISGQALLHQFRGARDNWLIAGFLLALMAADLALNQTGAYITIMPFQWPPVLVVYVPLLAITFIFNVGLQFACQFVAKDILFAPRAIGPDELRLPPVERSAQFRHPPHRVRGAGVRVPAARGAGK